MVYKYFAIIQLFFNGILMWMTDLLRMWMLSDRRSMRCV